MEESNEKTVMWIEKGVHTQLGVLKARWKEKSLSDTVARLIHEYQEHKQPGGKDGKPE